MAKVHSVETIASDGTYLYLTVDGQPYRIRWDDCSPRLRQTTFEQRKHLRCHHPAMESTGRRSMRIWRSPRCSSTRSA